MIRHIIAAITTLLAIWAMVYLYQKDQEVHKLESIKRIIEKTKMEVKLERNVQPVTQTASASASQTNEVAKAQQEKKRELDEKLQALRNKAGNVSAAFKVSPLYKQKCASCHGVNGEGIIGPKLIGQSAKKIHQALEDFKSGKRKNYVMYGLLSKMSEEEIRELSDEIGSFEAKKQAAQ